FLVVGVFLLDGVDLAPEVGDALIALGDRRGVGAELCVAIGDGLYRGGELGLAALDGVAGRRQATPQLVALGGELADLLGVLRLGVLALLLVLGGERGDRLGVLRVGDGLGLDQLAVGQRDRTLVLCLVVVEPLGGFALGSFALGGMA